MYESLIARDATMDPGAFVGRSHTTRDSVNGGHRLVQDHRRGLERIKPYCTLRRAGPGASLIGHALLIAKAN